MPTRGFEINTNDNSSRCLRVLLMFALAFGSLFFSASLLQAQDAATAAKEPDSDVKKGYLLDVPLPLNNAAVKQILEQLERLADTVPTGDRLTVVMRYRSGSETGAGTGFTDALKLAREMTQAKLLQLRIVSFVETSVTGHATLPILASASLVVTSGGAVSDATAGETASDELVAAGYKSIAAKRGLFPPQVVDALVDPGLELVRVSLVDGSQAFATGEELQELRKADKVVREDSWAVSGEPLQLDSARLREARFAAGLVESIDEAAEVWDLAEVIPVDEPQVSGDAVGALLEIAGSISPSRVRRWQSNLNATLESDVNTWLIALDSGGGDVDQSAILAGTFASPEPPLRKVVGLVRGEARGDAALIALSCRPLYMTRDAKLGGPGGDVVSADDLEIHKAIIDQIALNTRRPAALIRGLLNRDLVVYRYVKKKTGEIRYATEKEIVAQADDPELELDKWRRGDQINLAEGLTSKEALELGLIDGESDSLVDTARRTGLDEVPNPITDRGIVRFVEKLGRSHGFAFMLLFIGFVTLSIEANAPGMSVPGFISMVCFALFFWINFLAGTAEWLELLLFALGLICIAIEIFVIPGFGVFGIGGLAMTVLGLVLMSQTFVIPKNTYQITELTRGLWIALGGMFGMIGGFVAMRMLFPHIPLFKGLVMDTPNIEILNETEKLADFQHLSGQSGTTTTPLMPSGKARFGDEVVAVVSDGSAIAKGEAIRVVEIKGNRVVVESASQSS